MASQSAVQLLRERPLPDGRLEVQVVLACGCEVGLTVSSDRMVQLADGRRLAGGKYPCPAEHPVRRP